MMIQTMMMIDGYRPFLYLEWILVIRVVSIHQCNEAGGIGHVCDYLPSFPFILLVRVDTKEISFLGVGRMMRDFIGAQWLMVVIIVMVVIIMVVAMMIIMMGVYWCCSRSLHSTKPSSTTTTIHQYRWYSSIQHTVAAATWYSSSTSNPPCSIRMQQLHCWCSHHFQH